VNLATVPDCVIASKIAMSRDPLKAGYLKSEWIASEKEELSIFVPLGLCLQVGRGSENDLYLSNCVDVRAKLHRWPSDVDGLTDSNRADLAAPYAWHLVALLPCLHGRGLRPWHTSLPRLPHTRRLCVFVRWCGLIVACRLERCKPSDDHPSHVVVNIAVCLQPVGAGQPML